MLDPSARLLLRLALLAIAVAAPIVAFAGERKVDLDVEGEVRTIRTYATSASDLLERKGIRPERSDLVTPKKDLGDGGRVVYRRAKSIRLILDGEPRTVVARGLTVGDALNDLGLVPGPKDHVHPARATKLRPAMSLFVRNAIHAKVRADGRLRDVVSSADSVRNLLTHAGVGIGPDDYVFPAADTEPRDGMWIRVVRVQRIEDAKSVRIPFRYITHRDPEMESGVRKVIQQGAEGLKVQHFRVVLEDGRRVSSILLGERVVRSARDHVVRVGTKEPTFKGGGGSQEGLASWYSSDGLVAAHRSLPMGSVVRVTNVDTGQSVNVRIADRGPWVDGRVIDLSDDAFQRLAPLGKGTVKVKVQS
ncbi:MAG: ubiquitin-like domain-containing protein [Actinomycetota bacterium]